jgi:signal transduction histidine kinase
MLNTLMDISEAESGAMQLKREPIRLADIVARAVELYRDVAEAKGVSIDVRLKPDATTGEEIGAYVASGFSRTSGDVVVMADRTRMEQVAANLIDNAVKYTPAGGRVEVTVRREGDQAVVAVRDTGVGIPADELPRIWDRLFRGDTSRTERGLGLGLSLVRAIVQAHDGTVDVTSEPGVGSTFTVRLSLAV